MNEMSLSHLYRRLVSQRAQPVVSAEDLVDLVAASRDPSAMDPVRRERVLADLAQSRAHIELARLLNALQPASEAMAQQVREVRRSVHAPRHRDQRIAAGARRGRQARGLRWVAAMAACLSVAIGVWSWHHSDVQQPIAATHNAPLPDRIFTSGDTIFAASDSSHLKSSIGDHADELFRGNFSG